MMLELFAQRDQLFGRETRHFGLFPQPVQLFVLEQTRVLFGCFGRRRIVFGVLVLVVFVLFRCGGVVEVFEQVEHGHGGEQFLAQRCLLQSVLVVVLAV